MLIHHSIHFHARSYTAFLWWTIARTPLKFLFLPVGLICTILTATVVHAADVEGSVDYPLIPRYEDSNIVRYEKDAFSDYALRIGKTGTTGTKALEGSLIRITYRAPEGRSVLEVFNNYQAALEEAGFTLLFDCAKRACGDIRRAIESEYRYLLLSGDGNERYVAAHLVRPEGDVYTAVYVTRNTSGGPDRDRAMIQLDVVEMKPMENRMVVIKADKLGQDINTDGHVALYGITFDSDKATLRQESESQIEEIAKLLNGDPSLRVLVVGHTDNTGGFDYNMDLSQRRAQSVVNALTRQGVAQNRLLATGVGPAAPVANNGTEDGRALNRRVGIVKQ